MVSDRTNSRRMCQSQVDLERAPLGVDYRQSLSISNGPEVAWIDGWEESRTIGRWLWNCALTWLEIACGGRAHGRDARIARLREEIKSWFSPAAYALFLREIDKRLPGILAQVDGASARRTAKARNAANARWGNRPAAA